MNRIILIIGIAVGLLTLIFNAYISYAFIEELSLSIQKKNEKLEDIAQFQDYLSMLKDAETGQRGYIITGHQMYLEPYEQGLKFINSKKMQEFLEKSEKQKHISEDIKQLETLTRTKLDELQLVIDKYNSSGFEAAKEEVSTDIGKNTMDKIRTLIDNILIVKYKALDKYEKENNTHISFIINLIVSINIIYLILTIICLYILYLNISRGKEN